MMEPEQSEVLEYFLQQLRGQTSAGFLSTVQLYSSCIGCCVPENLPQAMLIWRNAVFQKAKQQKGWALYHADLDLASDLLHLDAEYGGRCYARVVHLVCDDSKQHNDAAGNAKEERLLLYAAHILDQVMA